jgi:hypothetical protein
VNDGVRDQTREVVRKAWLELRRPKAGSSPESQA